MTTYVRPSLSPISASVLFLGFEVAVDATLSPQRESRRLTTPQYFVSARSYMLFLYRSPSSYPTGYSPLPIAELRLKNSNFLYSSAPPAAGPPAGCVSFRHVPAFESAFLFVAVCGGRSYHVDTSNFLAGSSER